MMPDTLRARAARFRERAQFHRDLAALISPDSESEQLRDRARQYLAEAERLERQASVLERLGPVGGRKS